MKKNNDKQPSEYTRVKDKSSEQAFDKKASKLNPDDFEYVYAKDLDL